MTSTGALGSPHRQRAHRGVKVISVGLVAGFFFCMVLSSGSMKWYLEGNQIDSVEEKLWKNSTNVHCEMPARIDQLDTSNVSMAYRPYIRQPIVFAHIHMAKTAGSNLNGEMAHRFERICGNKGYSYDAAATNKRFIDKRTTNVNLNMDSYGKLRKMHSRARVPPGFMREIGFEDCDWVSTEEGWEIWKREFGNWRLPLEIHLPCREPIDHLLSQCNHRGMRFQCNNNTQAAFEQVDKCVLYLERFNMQLQDQFQVKCFDFLPHGRYLDYMGAQLQWKRPQKLEYKRRETNGKRNRAVECLWEDENAELREAIRAYMIQKWDYYQFCNKCIGTEDDIIATKK